MKTKISKTHKQESIVYLALWGTMFIVPVLSMQFRASETSMFPWRELFMVWKQIGFLFIAFLLHNYLLAPLLIHQQRRLLYFSGIALLVGCFTLFQCSQRPSLNERPDKRDHMHELNGERPPLPQDRDFDFMEEDGHGPHDIDKPHDLPPIFFGQQDIVMNIVLIMMLGMNLGVKLYFKQREDQQKLMELEKENLQQQLEYLRYQINPHFLMNTLNNIHALVDINSEEAKGTIVELSKIMRFALYEGARQRVPIARDVEFLKSYIKLMRLRYSDKVDIQIGLPEELPQVEIPPMIFITFVENAFKHGVSYRQKSFIHLTLQAQETKIVFECKNSKIQQDPLPDVQKLEREGGVGLQNVQRRLQLLYGDKYSLRINDEKEIYNIKLEIPLS